MHVESIERPWEALDGVVIARVLVGPRPSELGQALPRSHRHRWRRARDRRRRSEHGSGRPGPVRGSGGARPGRPRAARGAGDPRRGLGGDDLLRPRARHLRRSLGDPGPAGRRSAGRGLRGDVRARRRRPGPRDRDQPARPPVGARYRSRGGGCHRRAARASRHLGRRRRRTEGTSASVEVEDPERCPRYLARFIRGVADAPSPLRMQARLTRGRDATALGRRRRDELRDARARATDAPVRPRSVGRTTRSWFAGHGPGSGSSRSTTWSASWSTDDLLIADREKPVGIAGVMGSAAAEVSASTTEVLLESAWFEPRGILRTSRRLLLPTEAAIRFSRGTDPEGTGPAADRASSAHGRVGGAGRRPRRDRRRSRAAQAAHRRSTDACLARARARGLGLGRGRGPRADRHRPARQQDGAVVAEAPSFRPDLEREVDLIEEVARVQGYESIRSTLPGIRRVGEPDPSHAFRRRLRQRSSARACERFALLPFVVRADLELIGSRRRGRESRTRPRPTSRTCGGAASRTSCRRSRERWSAARRSVALFEIGHVFRTLDGIPSTSARS